MRWAIVVIWAGCSYNPRPSDPPNDGSVFPDEPPVTECEPNVTTCGASGRTLVTCNADGTGLDATKTELCPLLCSDADGAPRCYAASFLSDDAQRGCSGTLPMFAPTNDVQIRSNNGTPQLTCGVGTDGCGPGVGESVDGVLVDQVGGGAQIALFCFQSIAIGAAIDIDLDLQAPLANPITWFALGNVTLDGPLDVGGANASVVPATRGVAGPGGGNGGVASTAAGVDGVDSCAESRGRGGARNGGGAIGAAGGGGGGANLEIGGTGGVGREGGTAPGGVGGAECTTISSLVGGGGGGGGANNSCAGACGSGGGGGGGALHVVSGGALQIAGTLETNGGDGANGGNENAGTQPDGGGGGGGAGGTFVFEGTTVAITGMIRIRGGNGGDAEAGAGGRGAGNTPNNGLVGANGADQTQTGHEGAGGGGGAGRVFINVLGAVTPCNGVTTSPAGNTCTAGTLLAR